MLMTFIVGIYLSIPVPLCTIRQPVRKEEVMLSFLSQVPA